MAEEAVLFVWSQENKQMLIGPHKKWWHMLQYENKWMRKIGFQYRDKVENECMVRTDAMTNVIKREGGYLCHPSIY